MSVPARNKTPDLCILCVSESCLANNSCPPSGRVPLRLLLHQSRNGTGRYAQRGSSFGESWPGSSADVTERIPAKLTRVGTCQVPFLTNLLNRASAMAASNVSAARGSMLA